MGRRPSISIQALHLLPIPVGLLYSLVPTSAGSPPYSLHLLPIPVGLLILPCTHQCRQSPLLPPHATDSGWTAHTPLYPPVQAVPPTPSTCYRFRSDCSYSLVPVSAGSPPYSLHMLPIPVRLLVLPCTHQCRRSPLTPSACYRFQSDCSYSLVPTSAGGPPLLPPPATDSSRTARTPLYPPVQAVPPYSLRLLPIPVGLLVLPCTHQCRRSPLTPSACYRFQSDCSYSLVPTSAGGPPLLPPPATDSSRTARSPLYPPVQAVPPTPSTCYRFRSDCSFSLVPTSAGGPPLLPPPATDSSRTARTPLYPPVQAVPPYSLHLLPIPVGLLILPCTHQCRQSPLLPPHATDSSQTARSPLYPPVQAVPPTPSTCYRFRSDCSYSLVPVSAGGPPLLPPPATDSSRTARTPLYPSVQAVPPYSLPLFFSCPGWRNW